MNAIFATLSPKPKALNLAKVQEGRPLETSSATSGVHALGHSGAESGLYMG